MYFLLALKGRIKEMGCLLSLYHNSPLIPTGVSKRVCVIARHTSKSLLYSFKLVNLCCEVPNPVEIDMSSRTSVFLVSYCLILKDLYT